MFTRSTWIKIWRQGVRLGYLRPGPLCTGYSTNQPKRGRNPTAFSTSGRTECCEKISTIPTFVMFADYRNGKIWYEPSARTRDNQKKPEQC